MQLDISTDYAIRVLLCLGEEGNRVTGGEISNEMAIPERYLLKVLNKLRNGGLIQSFSGNAGGYELSKSLSRITLWDVLVTMEETMEINPCLQDEENCSRHATATCPVRRFYCSFQLTIEQILRSVSLKSIQNQKSEYAHPSPMNEIYAFAVGDSG